MKILQIGKFYPIRGGVEKVMYDLMLGLSAQQVHCDMLCASTEDYPASTIQLNPFATLMVMPTKVKLAATMLAPDMIGKLRSIAKDYDIIHIHHPDPMATLALFLSGYKGKVMLHWHSDILKQKMLLKAYKPLQNWLLKRADLIVGTTPVYVAQSPFLKNFQHKIDYIPIGIPAMTYDQASAEKIQESYNHRKIIFSLGRLVEYKGFRYLIDAARHLDDSYVVLIGGKGPLKEELEQQIAEYQLQDKVKLLGFIADEDIPSYYGASTLFCLSSIIKTEAFGIVQLEAMSCGKPIVSTDIPESGVSWVNKKDESGLIVPIEDGLAIANAIKIITENKEYFNKLVVAGKNRFQSNFTLANMVDKSLQLYKQILSN